MEARIEAMLVAPGSAVVEYGSQRAEPRRGQRPPGIYPSLDNTAVFGFTLHEHVNECAGPVTMPCAIFVKGSQNLVEHLLTAGVRAITVVEHEHLVERRLRPSRR